MSPRSEEYLAGAREALAASRVLLDAGHLRPAAAEGYYAMLYAARGALSEEDVAAKTHRGTWGEFGRVFVATGRFDVELARAAARAQGDRERAAYDLEEIELERAEAILEDAAAFVTAVEAMFG